MTDSARVGFPGSAPAVDLGPMAERIARVLQGRSPAAGGVQPELSREQIETVLQVLGTVGCKLELPREDAASPALLQTDALRRMLDDPSCSLAGLLGCWRERDVREWRQQPELYRALATRLLQLGVPMPAHEVAIEGLEFWPDDVPLRQTLGLALARCGAMDRARDVLERLDQDGHGDEVTLGLLARMHKFWGTTAGDRRDRDRALRLAYEKYREAYARFGGSWAGINAASLGLLLGETDAAHRLAQEVRAQCLSDLAGGAAGTDPYWALATLGEAALVLEDWPEATARYAEAASLGRNRLGDLKSTRQNARLLLASRGDDPAGIERILQVPRVIVFAGHLIDQSERREPRFPASAETAVAAAIRTRVAALNGRVGYASAACGADLLFHEAVLGLSGESHVILPYEREAFARQSVDVAPGRWRERFDTVLGRAVEVTAVSTDPMSGRTGYDYANLVLYGLAGLRAAELETELVPVVLWDGRAADGPGGTADAVSLWATVGRSVQQIDLGAVRSGQRTSVVAAAEPPARDVCVESPDSPVRAMLFADAVKFSKLSEEQMPRFVQSFLGSIAELVTRWTDVVLARQTAGDGLYLVFDEPRSAGKFALDLCDLVTGTDWASHGLPGELNLRIALHAGPVFRLNDPITGLTTYTGQHVCRVARMEPVTPPGSVYASQAFAAMAFATGVRDFECEYVKLMPLAKGYGTHPTYIVRRR